MNDQTKENLTIIIPCYNEEDNVESTIKEVSKTNPLATILIVDDHSSDKTGEIVQKLQSTNQYNLQLISNEKNQGYGGALIIGFFKCNTKNVAFVDADLTYSPHYLPEMETVLEKYNLDVVWGNRFGGTTNKMPLIRKIGNKIIALTCFLVTRKSIPDCTSGMRVFRHNSLMKLDVQSLPKGLDMITAMTKRTVTRNLNYKLIPINYLARGGQSKLNITTDFIQMMKNIIYEK